MYITLTFSPEKEAALLKHAAAAGTDPTNFILDAVEEKLEEEIDSSAAIPYEPWRDEFRSWISRQRSRNPQFDDSRESIYE